MNLRLALAALPPLAALAVGFAAAPAWAASACSTDPTQCLCTLHTDDCSQAIQNSGGVMNAIFTDSGGHTADQLPVYGKLYNIWQGCPTNEVNPGCAGTSNATPLPSYNCPGNYTCAYPGGAFATASTYLDALDHIWWQPCRLAVPDLMTVGASVCPANWACITDQVGGNYVPWEGLVFDLGGPSNKVAIFAENDHGPQPCESLEYTVFLTDNPSPSTNTQIILDPKTQGVDPMKWNRAVLSKVYTWGWFNTRAPDVAGHGATCGDTANYAVEDDSFAQVFSLPCGITFRYASIVAGNDGLDFPECTYHSSEAELDAVAGLTESGAAVCPDADGDHYVDCNCPTAPPICDCNDNDPTIHPGALEACDSPDLNCDGIPGSCTGNLVCYQSICDTTCGGGENPFCPAGSVCTATANGKLCVPQSCTNSTCPPGGVCKNGMCVPACDGVVCPGTQICQDGGCLDPCANLQCPSGQTCQGGNCLSPCNCFAGNIGCANIPGTVCDAGNTNLCVPPACQGVTCPAGNTCNPINGQCVSFCNSGVTCPNGQKCVDPGGCVPVCQGVTCQGDLTCDPMTGQCVDMTCVGITCFAPQVCVMGQCATPDGGPAGGGGAGGGEATTGSSMSGTGGMGGALTSTGSSTGGSGGTTTEKGKCSCNVVGDDDGDGSGLGAMAAMAGLSVIVARRRRR